MRLLLGRAFLADGLLELAEEELRAAADMPLEPADEIRAGYLLGCVLETRGQIDAAVRAAGRTSAVVLLWRPGWRMRVVSQARAPPSTGPQP